jgi:hypothetical protein
VRIDEMNYLVGTTAWDIATQRLMLLFEFTMALAEGVLRTSHSRRRRMAYRR